MALIKCNECGREISSNAQFCAGCGAQINKQMYTDLEEKNIMTILKYANALQIIYIVLGVITLIGCFSEIWYICLPTGIALIISGIVHPAMITNKALILKNLYELNRKD